MSAQTKAKYREQAAARVAAAQEVLATEVAALVTGDDWRQFLDFQAKLHDYSANNVMLIFAQQSKAYEEGRVPDPAPTYVAGFRTWRALGRQVDRGQHGFAILAPMRSVRREARDSEGNVRVLRRNDRMQAGRLRPERRCSGASPSRRCSTSARHQGRHYPTRLGPF